MSVGINEEIEMKRLDFRVSTPMVFPHYYGKGIGTLNTSKAMLAVA